eukprot:CAMPEP_0182469082 /NCGR_PEP_ID=MMETSP1319-20130603/16516_1 /TAXON_ID=172717 /ORGANISM="Bolidomonas pacifica, Strain RCC208" /LENGTH=121 /DNA_ID=CAMNT_0024669349 /DNA_START=13 /DNA_END=374 /DNA_ORIENTATION=-
MEEADSLLLSSLSPALKLLPAPAPNVSTLQSLLSLNLLYPVVSASLSVLDGGDVEELPKTTSKKHRACAKMAERVKAVGYSGEMGYNTILYPSLQSSRSLLSYLAESLQKNSQSLEELEAS